MLLIRPRKIKTQPRGAGNQRAELTAQIVGTIVSKTNNAASASIFLGV